MVVATAAAVGVAAGVPAADGSEPDSSRMAWCSIRMRADAVATSSRSGRSAGVLASKSARHEASSEPTRGVNTLGTDNPASAGASRHALEQPNVACDPQEGRRQQLLQRSETAALTGGERLHTAPSGGAHSQSVRHAAIRRTFPPLRSRTSRKAANAGLPAATRSMVVRACGKLAAYGR